MPRSETLKGWRAVVSSVSALKSYFRGFALQAMAERESRSRSRPREQLEPWEFRGCVSRCPAELQIIKLESSASLVHGRGMSGRSRDGRSESHDRIGRQVKLGHVSAFGFGHLLLL